MESREVEIEAIEPGTILTSFTGRLSRLTFLKYTALLTIPFVLAAILLPGFGRNVLSTFVLGAIYVFCGTALDIKRLHDQNLSGWMMIPLHAGPKILGSLATLVLGEFGVVLAILGWLGSIYVYFLRSGSPEANNYGAVEKSGAYHHVPDQGAIDFYASL